MKSIPMKKASEIAKEFGAARVIIIAEATDGSAHCTTYGRTSDHCVQAAHKGNLFKRLLGWGDKDYSIPSQIKNKPVELSRFVKNEETTTQWVKAFRKLKGE